MSAASYEPYHSTSPINDIHALRSRAPPKCRCRRELIDFVAGYGGYGRAMDATVTVYEYEKFDPQQRRWRKAETMATAVAIERAGGVMLRLTALVVDASRVDEP